MLAICNIARNIVRKKRISNFDDTMLLTYYTNIVYNIYVYLSVCIYYVCTNIYDECESELLTSFDYTYRKTAFSRTSFENIF